MSAAIALFPSPYRKAERLHAARALRRAGYEMHVLRLPSGQLVPEFRRAAPAAPGQILPTGWEGA